MRSFAVIAGLAASAQAAAVYGDYPAYNASSAVETPVYEATASIPAYETSAPVYEVSTIHTVDCPKPTTIVYGTSSIVVESSTVITYTEVYETTKTPEAAKPTAHYSEAPPAPVHPTEHSEAPAPTHTPVPYPSSNGTHPTAVYPTASAPPTKPTTTAPPEFTGAASKATFGFLAIAGAVAALL